jgi:SAM-dependent methyltransferase
MTDRRRVRELAARALEAGDPLAWFEELYAGADGDRAAVPWADGVPNPLLVEWLDRERVSGDGRAALKVGCGLGDDAEELARRGFAVTAFDVAPTAVAWCRERFPGSAVRYLVRDLFDLPPAWEDRFALVLEANTLQVFPSELRASAMARIAACVAPGGTLLAIARAREPEEPTGPIPWPLVRDELRGFEEAGLVRVEFEDLVDAEDPPVRRFRATYRRPAPAP